MDRLLAAPNGNLLALAQIAAGQLVGLKCEFAHGRRIIYAPSGLQKQLVRAVLKKVSTSRVERPRMETLITRRSGPSLDVKTLNRKACKH